MTAPQDPGSAAKHPARISDLSDELRQVAELIANAKKTFFGIALACAYSFLTLFSTTDAQLLSNSSTSKLPIIQAEIPIVWFFVIVPLALTCGYFYFQMYLQGLWRCTSRLPARSGEDRPIDDYVYPWMISSSLVRSYAARGKLGRRPMLGVEKLATHFLCWWLVPVTLAGFWLRYLIAHDWPVTALHIALLIVIVAGGISFYRMAVTTLRREEPRAVPAWRAPASLRTLAWPAVVAGLLLFFSVGAIEGAPASHCEGLKVKPIPRQRVWPACSPGTAAGRWLGSLGLASAGFAGADVSTRPSDWSAKLELLELESAEESAQPPDSARDLELLEKKLRQLKRELRLVQGARLMGSDLRHARANEAFLVAADLTGEADLRWIRLEEASLQGARLEKAKLQGAHLEKAHLQLAELKGADLTGAHLVAADLQGASLDGAHFDLARLDAADLTRAQGTGASFKGAELKEATLDAADLKQARLQGAKLTLTSMRQIVLRDANLTRAVLRGVKLEGADLRRARLRGAYLLDGVDMSGANLEAADFRLAEMRGAILSGANLSATNFQLAHLDKADLRGATGESTDLREATLEEADLREVRIKFVEAAGADLTKADLTRAQLHNADFSKANLSGAIFDYATLTGANFFEATLEETRFDEAQMAGSAMKFVKARGAVLTGAVLYRAQLQQADLTDAKLAGANLTEAALAGANLNGADLTGAIGLTRAQLSAACVAPQGDQPGQAAAQPRLPPEFRGLSLPPCP